MDKKEAIERIKRHMIAHQIGAYPHIKLAEALSMAIEALQEPERKKGHWKRFHKYEFGSDKWGYRCSECGNEIYDDDSSIIKNFLPPNFCERCGTDMRDTEAGPDFIDTGDW